MSFDAIRESFISRGFTFADWIDPANGEWKNLRHSDDKILAVIVGRLHLSTFDQDVELGPGDEVYIPADTIHHLKNTTGALCRFAFGYKPTVNNSNSPS